MFTRTSGKIIYYILAGFVTGTLLLIFIQYNSSKNINKLITGNEQLINEFNVSSELKDLESDISEVEAKINRTVATGDPSHIEGLKVQIAEIEGNLNQLQKVSDDDSSVKYIDVLDTMVHRKLRFGDEVLDSFNITGKVTAERLIATKRGKLLADSIVATVHRIDSTRKRILAEATASIDKSGKRALQFSAILTTLVLITAAGLFWYIINTIRRQLRLISDLNVSEKKVKESARIKENFMANMSHEIRTPMNAILGFTNLLQRQSLDQQSKEYVQSIQKSGENLLAIINDILDLSKIEAGMMSIEAAPFSIRGLLHSVETMFNGKAMEKGIMLSTSVHDSVPETLEGDATRLTQILVNLIGNALKFTREGSIKVVVTGGTIKDNIIDTIISISDTGIGIEESKLKDIFNRFQQAEDSVTRNYGGTGLGLSIVNELVLLQKGTINVKSKKDSGSVFTVMIPYKIVTDFPVVSGTKSSYLPVADDFRNIRILAVEDNEINQSLLKHLFNEWKLNFDLAANGKKAIEKLRTGKYDLVLMDIQMPEMDGYTTTQEIRQVLKLETPIIAMTAHALAGEREKCLSYGMNEYIPKPIREEQLHELIRQFTGLKPLINQTDNKANSKDAANYKYINLQYMREISGGNRAYEKTVTEQFLEAVPDEIAAIHNSLLQKDISVLRQLAHNMRTTVSVMGLNEKLQPYLDLLEYENYHDQRFSEAFNSLQAVCKEATAEARHFYSTL